MDMVEKPVLLGIGDDQVDEAGRFARLVRGIAPGEDGPRSAPGSFPRSPRRRVGDRAGVDHMQVGLAGRGHNQVPGGQEVPGQTLGLRLVELAAQMGNTNAHGLNLPEIYLPPQSFHVHWRPP